MLTSGEIFIKVANRRPFSMGARLTRFIQSIREILDTFDVAVLDQWGVLHNGSVPYPHAAEAITLLHEHGKRA